MTFAVSAIDETLQLLHRTAIPDRTKIVIAANLSAAKEILERDPFQAIRCDFFLKSQLQNLLKTLHDRNECGEEKILEMVADSCTLLLFLGVSSPDGQTSSASCS